MMLVHMFDSQRGQHSQMLRRLLSNPSPRRCISLPVRSYKAQKIWSSQSRSLKCKRTLRDQHVRDLKCVNKSHAKLKVLECGLTKKEKDIAVLAEKHHREVQEHAGTFMRVTQMKDELQLRLSQVESASRDVLRRHEQEIHEKE
ncbi:hypothetical protein XENOCAPTIV_010264 [Xenoophorus captivus]|uniref:Uncharacterized protein n=1 Tax=Xenoophorus captivus TaxID=1517983 RepID=A0ABV0RPW6_9TELE